VWQVWTTPEHLAHWWGPKGWTLPVCQVDLRPGGVWLYCMRGPGGEDAWGKAVYREIVEPERIVYLDTFVDADGNLLEGMPELTITVTFEDVNGKTKVTSLVDFASAAELEQVLSMGMEQGLADTWARLEAYLAQL
jgi:uncharacterized protein YndB with AHSA1/START domain